MTTTRRQTKDARRASLLQAALAEFNERGFHGASTRSITSAAGISSGLLFHYFASKEALYEELIALGFAEFEADADAAVADPLGFLRGVAEGVLGLLRLTPEASAMFTFMARAERHPGISARADELLTRHDLLPVLVSCLAAGQQADLIRPGNPHALALAFWSALQGLAEALGAHPDAPLPEADWLLAIVVNPATEPDREPGA
ncbi:TetR/AcrR family transcriptional regulator [Granulicoccus sp. GXG6511]|uniref:TetR/AcrR family transcriptional regulator n=1 Tax=Granulicoccus sp. GXG6511 TaxID=3381351 RepID=UPI003D7E19AD